MKTLEEAGHEYATNLYRSGYSDWAEHNKDYDTFKAGAAFVKSQFNSLENDFGNEFNAVVVLKSQLESARGRIDELTKALEKISEQRFGDGSETESQTMRRVAREALKGGVANLTEPMAHNQGDEK